MRLLCVALFAFALHAQRSPGFFPIEKGTTWIYAGSIATGGSGSRIDRSQVTWTMEVLDSISTGHFKIALLKGHPWDVVRYGANATRNCYLLTAVDDREFYLQDLETHCVLPRDKFSDLATPSHLFLKWPASEGDSFGGDADPPRNDNMYSWVVESIKPATLRGIKGASQARSLPSCQLIYRSTSSHETATYVPGLGLVDFKSSHHGTVSDIAMHLVEFRRPANAPALPFTDWNVCPGEGCRYGRWTARKPVAVYDTWKPNRRTMSKIAPGESVQGLTGGVITYQPGVIRMDRDLPQYNLKTGDTILTYTYRGEGISAVWFNGKYQPDFDISFVRFPDGTGCGGANCAASITEGRRIWWAQVRLASGRTGWVKMDDDAFDGTCSLRAP